MHKAALFFDHVNICVMTSKERYISNSTSPKDTKLGRLVAYVMGLTLTKPHHS